MMGGGGEEVYSIIMLVGSSTTVAEPYLYYGRTKYINCQLKQINFHIVRSI